MKSKRWIGSGNEKPFSQAPLIKFNPLLCHISSCVLFLCTYKGLWWVDGGRLCQHFSSYPISLESPAPSRQKGSSSLALDCLSFDI